MSAGQETTDVCKLCGGKPLDVLEHVARCTQCGALMYFPYPTTADVVASGFYTFEADGAEGYFRAWYAQAAPRNRVNLAHILRFALGDLDAPLDLLDYGGGGGQFATVANSLSPQAHTFITDLYDDALRPEWAPFNTQIPFADFAADAHRFDVIFLNDVFEHVEDPVALLRQLEAKLKPGGKIVVNTPRPLWFLPAMQRVTPGLYGKILRGTVTMGHLQLWTRKAVNRSAARAGLRIVRWQEKSEFTMGPDFYVESLGLTGPVLRAAGRAFYALAPWIGRNKILALLEPAAQP